MMMHARQLCVALALAFGPIGPALADEPPAAASQGREAMRQAREQARDAMKEAREAVHDAPKEAHAAMEKARDEVKKAREQGHEALEQARAVMVKAREQVQQAMPGVPGAASRKDQARYARRAAWHALMNRVSRPSEIAQPVRQELRLHALRMAKLQRIHALATSKHDTAIVARCDKLLAREQTRHEKKLAALLPAQAQVPAAAAADDDDPGEAEDSDDHEQEGEP